MRSVSFSTMGTALPRVPSRNDPEVAYRSWSVKATVVQQRRCKCQVVEQIEMWHAYVGEGDVSIAFTACLSCHMEHTKDDTLNAADDHPSRISSNSSLSSSSVRRPPPAFLNVRLGPHKIRVLQTSRSFWRVWQRTVHSSVHLPFLRPLSAPHGAQRLAKAGLEWGGGLADPLKFVADVRIAYGPYENRRIMLHEKLDFWPCWKMVPESLTEQMPRLIQNHHFTSTQICLYNCVNPENCKFCVQLKKPRLSLKTYCIWARSVWRNVIHE